MTQRRLRTDKRKLRMTQAEEHRRVRWINVDGVVGSAGGTGQVKPGVRGSRQAGIQRIGLALENPALMRLRPANGQRSATQAEGDVGRVGTSRRGDGEAARGKRRGTVGEGSRGPGCSGGETSHDNHVIADGAAGGGSSRNDIGIG